MKWNEFIVTGDPMILGAQISIVLVSIGVVALLTYTKKWKWLMKEWISSVDHKKIGIMYLLAAVLMFFRGGVDALMMRTQLALPDMKFLDAQHYNEVFFYTWNDYDFIYGDAVYHRIDEHCRTTSNWCA